MRLVRKVARKGKSKVYLSAVGIGNSTLLKLMGVGFKSSHPDHIKTIRLISFLSALFNF